MRKMSPRQAKRLMSQMGMRIEELDNVQQVIIRTPRKEVVIDNPEVNITHMHGQRIYQVMGGNVLEREAATPQPVKQLIIPEEDIHLVSQQAKVNLEAAKKALIETKGDLAQAILNLSQR
jgi:nascent polypeptide-associated complex subunit alpha